MVDDDTRNQLLNDVSIRVEDTYFLIDNLLLWSKNQMQRIVCLPVHFDIKEVINPIFETLREIADTKKISLDNNINNQKIFADKDMFSIVLRNLVMNAIKYSYLEGKVILNSELFENKLIISVQDFGAGMSQKAQNNLFKLTETKSQRGTNNETGTGLEMVLCADFIKINGGNIWFYSKEGEGTTFYFSVPI
jgi:two-component system sensor histidine kinase/response regulator